MYERASDRLLDPETVIRIAVRSASKIVGYADAYDIAQDVWIRYQREGKCKNARAWIHVVARNLALDSFRHKEIPYELFDIPDNTFDPFKVEETQRRVEALLNTLSEENRQLMHLRYYKDMSWLEVSKIMGKSENAVRCRFFQIKKRWTSGKIHINV